MLVVAPEPVGDLTVGSEIRAEGVLETPEPWRAGYLRRQGIAMTLRTERIDEPAGPPRRTRGMDRRDHGSGPRSALGRGMPESEAALARGFVLGEDDRIDHGTREDFQRSNLTHLLAVSGENVILLCVLAWPLLALLGLPLRARLVGALCLIAIYVPVTGAGPSIQRAGVMGAAGLIAALADRPRSRWYAVLLAAAITLAINPRADGDVGWQLSFAAVIGIMLWARRLAALFSGIGGARIGSLPPLAEAVAVTVVGDRRDRAADGGGLRSALSRRASRQRARRSRRRAGDVARHAHGDRRPAAAAPGGADQLARLALPRLHRPDRALARRTALGAADRAPRLGLVGRRRVRGPPGGRWSCCCAWLAAATRPIGQAAAAPRSPFAAAVLLALIAVVPCAGRSAPRLPQARPPGDLAVRSPRRRPGRLDPARSPDGDPVLVDTGPPEDGVEDRLRELGIHSLAAIVISHDQSDHAGDLGALLGSRPRRSRRLRPGRSAAARRGARRAALTPYRLAEGGEIDSGSLRLSALWPPRELLGETGEDPNLLCLVLVAQWRHFSMLLTGDAEAEAVPMDPGPVDVLKVAHHGSADAGLGELLDRAVPKLAVISVGAGNSYGHPTMPRSTSSRRTMCPSCAPTCRARSPSTRTVPGGRCIRTGDSLSAPTTRPTTRWSSRTMPSPGLTGRRSLSRRSAPTRLRRPARRRESGHRGPVARRSP